LTKAANQPEKKSQPKMQRTKRFGRFHKSKTLRTEGDQPTRKIGIAGGKSDGVGNKLQANLNYTAVKDQ